MHDVGEYLLRLSLLFSLSTHASSQQQKSQPTATYSSTHDEIPELPTLAGLSKRITTRAARLTSERDLINLESSPLDLYTVSKSIHFTSLMCSDKLKLRAGRRLSLQIAHIAGFGFTVSILFLNICAQAHAHSFNSNSSARPA